MLAFFRLTCFPTVSSFLSPLSPLRLGRLGDSLKALGSLGLFSEPESERIVSNHIQETCHTWSAAFPDRYYCPKTFGEASTLWAKLLNPTEWLWRTKSTGGVDSRRHLRSMDREAFEQLMDACRGFASAGSNATQPILFEPMVMSIVLFQQKQLTKLEKELDALKQRVK